MIPNASDLTYFVEIANTSNLSRAAERLGVSQPSLSLALRRLEECVGAELFMRSKRGVHLTPSGKRLLAEVRLLFQDWEAVATAARSSQNEVAGTYRLGCHPSVAVYSLPGFLPRLLRDHKTLEIRLEHDLSRKITESVISLQLDMGLVINPARHPDLVITELCRDEVTLYSVPGNSNQDVLVCDPSLTQSQALLKKFRLSGIEFKRFLYSSNLEVITALVAAGCGQGILPGRVAAQSSRLKMLKGAPLFEDELCLVYRAEAKKVKALMEIAERIKRSFKG